jgi:hypothetical protein
MLCGAHTISGIYHVISGHSGQIEGIVKLDTELNKATRHLREEKIWDFGKEWSSAGIPVISPAPLVITKTNNLPALFIQGHGFGSIGAGLYRPLTEIWSWDGNALTLTNVQPNDLYNRVHVLFDANFSFALGNIKTAKQNYEAHVQDKCNLAEAAPTPPGQAWEPGLLCTSS